MIDQAPRWCGACPDRQAATAKEARIMMTMIEDIDDTHPDHARIIGALRADRCPDCDAFDLVGGPRGGAGQNIFCGRCGSGFNVAQPRFIMMVQRIGRRPPIAKGRPP